MALSRSVLDRAANSPDLAISKFAKAATQSMEAIAEDSLIERTWEAVKKFIAERDEFRCRVCGRSCRYGAPKLAERADPHHIILRSAGGPDESWNLIYLCRGCHDLVHKLRKLFLSGNADAKDEMGRGMVKAERQVEGGFEVVGFV